MSAWAMAALNGHFECFRILEQIVPTIAARKQFFEMQDDFGRSFMHLAAISGYSRLTWACFSRNFVFNKLFSILFKAIMSAWISFWKPTAIPTRWTWTASELKNFSGDENYKNLRHQATVLIQPFRIDVFDFGNSYFLSK